MTNGINSVIFVHFMCNVVETKCLIYPNIYFLNKRERKEKIMK